MTGRLFVRNDDGDMEEVANFPLEGWQVEESAEEGNASSAQITIPDPDMTYTFTGWRRWILYEDDSEDANQVLASGFLGIQQVGRKVGEYYEPLGRVWGLAVTDMNNLWDRRLNVGADTDRPAETDIERMTWLLTDTEEMSYVDDITFVSAASDEDLDARDTARTSTKSVADECSQQSGKNYWLGCSGAVADVPSSSDIFAWYGKDSLTTYTSDLSLSNDPNDWLDSELLDGTSLVWPISDDTLLDRDPGRVYDGMLVEYENGSVYRKRAATTSFFTLSGRDLSTPAPEIKTKAKAKRRADRQLVDHSIQDEVLTVRVRLPAAKATMIRAGMRILVRATHIPNWENFGYARILTCGIAPAAAGTQYDLTLKLQGPTTATSCGMALAARDTAHADTGGYTVSTATVDIAVSAGPAVIVAAAIAKNSNTPTCSAMTPSGSYTQIFSQNLTLAGTAHPATALMYRAVSGAGTYTVSATYTSGFSPGDSEHWGVAAMAFASSATAPVQDATDEFAVSDSVGATTLGSTPSTGNLLIASVTLKDMSSDADIDAVVMDQAGWTRVVTTRAAVGVGIDCSILFAKCADADDGSTFSVSGLSKGGIISLSEWTL